jgi:VanZ family protein
MYGIAAVLFMKDFRSKTSMKKSAVLSIIIASLYGFVIELIQSAIPWRECSFSDMMANVGGAVFFTLLYILVGYYREKI